MIVVAVDPGSRVTGYSVITRKSGKIILLDAGCIRTDTEQSMEIRLHQIFSKLDEILTTHQPTTAAIEEIFAGKSIQSAIVLGQARGVALMTLAKHNLVVSAYHPLTIKKQVGGHGKSAKQDIIRMVSRLLNLDYELPADAADATAIAITHLIHSSFSLQSKRNTRSSTEPSNPPSEQQSTIPKTTPNPTKTPKPKLNRLQELLKQAKKKPKK